GEGDGDVFAGVGRAPDGDGLVALEHGVVREQRCGDDVGVQVRAEAQECQTGEAKLTHGKTSHARACADGDSVSYGNIRFFVRGRAGGERVWQRDADKRSLPAIATVRDVRDTRLPCPTTPAAALFSG